MSLYFRRIFRSVARFVRVGALAGSFFSWPQGLTAADFEVAAITEPTPVAPWFDSAHQQEWRLLSLGAPWAKARKICRAAKMRLPTIDALQIAQPHLLSVSAGQQALEVSELVWSANSWSDASNGGRASAIVMSMRSGENTSVGKDNHLPVLCVRPIRRR